MPLTFAQELEVIDAETPATVSPPPSVADAPSPVVPPATDGAAGGAVASAPSDTPPAAPTADGGGAAIVPTQADPSPAVATPAAPDPLQAELDAANAKIAELENLLSQFSGANVI